MTDFRKYTPDDEYKRREHQQGVESSKDVIKEYEKQNSKINLKFKIVIIIAIVSILGSFVYFSNVANSSEFNTKFVIENLQGEPIDTWRVWKLTDDDLLHIHVVESQYATPVRLDAIKDVMMSTDSNDGRFAGWGGALDTISTDTVFSIPNNLHFDVTSDGVGHVLINLENYSDSDGFDGFTTAIVDEKNNQILKASITIYNVNSLTTDELQTIIRHELGHAFGLGHSDDEDDLMHFKIITTNPLISECNVKSIENLYDDKHDLDFLC